MRLWHVDLIPKLPRQQLQGQHRECCALRGNGWGKKHSTIDYIFNHNPFKLYCYHLKVMAELKRRNPDINLDTKWVNPSYRGKNCNQWGKEQLDTSDDERYPEHDSLYYQKCIENLQKKGTKIE